MTPQDALTAQYQITSGLESGDNEPTYTKEQGKLCLMNNKPKYRTNFRSFEIKNGGRGQGGWCIGNHISAIKMIQSFERGRQALLRTRFMKEIRGQVCQQSDALFLTNQEGKDRKSGSRAVPLDSNVAAVRIQRLFRGYSARCLVAQEREEELIMLGRWRFSGGIHAFLW